MICSKHPDIESEYLLSKGFDISDLVFMGYWTGKYEPSYLPDPREFIEDGFGQTDEGILAVDYLKSGETFLMWMGFSECRLCGKHIGNRCLTDGKYVWPEGLYHYVECHNVKPPFAFIERAKESRK